jgi:hypothetical protein
MPRARDSLNRREGLNVIKERPDQDQAAGTADPGGPVRGHREHVPSVGVTTTFGTYLKIEDISNSGATQFSSTDMAHVINPWLAGLTKGTAVYVGGNYYIGSRIQIVVDDILLFGNTATDCGFTALSSTASDAGCSSTKGSPNIVDSGATSAWIGFAVASSAGNIAPGSVITAVTSSPTGYTLSLNALATSASFTLEVGFDYYMLSNWVPGDYVAPMSLPSVTVTLNSNAISGVPTGTPYPLPITCLTPAIFAPGTFLLFNSMTSTYYLSINARGSKSSFTAYLGDFYPGTLAQSDTIGGSDVGPASPTSPLLTCPFYAPTNDANGVRYVHLEHLFFDLNDVEFGPDGTTPTTAIGLVHPQERTRIRDIQLRHGSASVGDFSSYGLALFSNNTYRTAGRYTIREVVQYGNGNWKSLLYADGTNGGTLSGNVGDVDFQDYTTCAAGQGTSPGTTAGYGGSPILLNQVSGARLTGHHEGMPESSATNAGMIRAVDCIGIQAEVDFHIGGVVGIAAPAVRGDTSSVLPQQLWGMADGKTVGQNWPTVEPDLSRSQVHDEGGYFNSEFYSFFPAAGQSITIAASGSAAATPVSLLRFNAAGKLWLDYGSNLNVSPAAYTLFSSTGTFTVPAGVTELRVRLIGGGGGGGGGGSATMSSSTLQAGGGGGGAGLVIDQVIAVTPGQTLTLSVGAGGTGGPGGAANDHAGTNGTRGSDTLLKDGSGNALLTALGGAHGLGGAGNSQVVTAAGGYGSLQSTSTFTTAPDTGFGGPSGGGSAVAFSSGSPFIAVVGGGGGGAATSTKGGGGGWAQAAISPSNQLNPQAGGGNGASSTASGQAGAAAGQPGCGGGGGGGGSGAGSGGAGGGGGNGASGQGEIWVLGPD